MGKEAVLCGGWREGILGFMLLMEGKWGIWLLWGLGGFPSWVSGVKGDFVLDGGFSMGLR